jgi:long-chain acyl-CoA synthetase
MGNLAQNMLDTAAEHGRRPALRMGDTVLSYQQFVDAARRLPPGWRLAASCPVTGWAWCCPTSCPFPFSSTGRQSREQRWFR